MDDQKCDYKVLEHPECSTCDCLIVEEGLYICSMHLKNDAGNDTMPDYSDKIK